MSKTDMRYLPYDVRMDVSDLKRVIRDGGDIDYAIAALVASVFNWSKREEHARIRDEVAKIEAGATVDHVNDHTLRNSIRDVLSDFREESRR